MAEVFIFYAREDKEFARRLHAALAEHSREAWINWQGIPPTAEWSKEICRNIETADNFVFSVSPDSCGSETCQREIAYTETHHKRLIPIVCRSVEPKDLPEQEPKHFGVKHAETVERSDGVLMEPTGAAAIIRQINGGSTNSSWRAT